MPSEFVGVDGCRCGWVGVGYSGGGEYELKAFPSFDEVVEYYRAAKLLLVDMPIGFSEGAAERHCDPEAREWLSHKGPTILRAPTRQALAYLADNPGDGEGAKAVNRDITGKMVTKQTLAVMPKINAVDRVMRARGRNVSPEIREVHPEVCFWGLNYRSSMNFKKKDASGIEERLRVLERAGVEPRARDIFRAGCDQFLRKDVARGEILDALAAAVTAWRGWPDRLRALPERRERQTDGVGLPMEMVFWVP